MKIFLNIALICLVLMFLPINIIYADNGFTFSTESQSVLPNDLSGPITIHSENPVSETTYIILISTSATGQFFSNKTSSEPIPEGSYVYISTNNSNRTVYYKDSNVGDFVITAKIFNKEKTNQIATISQNISVGQSITTNNSTTSESVNTNNDDTTSSSQSNNTSAHSSPAKLSSVEQKMEFEISAGRDRLTTVGNSLVFKAVTTKIQNIPESWITYVWSFGDGTSLQGNNINHTYKFEGEYSVVVNAYYSDKQAVSRMKVKVVSPNIDVLKVTGGLEILNNSSSEINLGGWSLVSGNKNFVFPSDTLIPAGKKIIFADEVTLITNNEIQILNPLGKTILSIKNNAVIEDGGVTAQQPKITSGNLEKIVTRVEEIKKEFAQISSSQLNTLQVTVISPTKESNELPKENLSFGGDTEEINTNIAQVFEAEKEIGLVNRVFKWPIKTFDFFLRLFIEE